MIDWRFVARELGRLGPPVLFAAVSTRGLFADAVLGQFGIDARTYYAGLQAFLGGHDPWVASVALPDGRVFHYAGAPTTLILTVPMAPLGEAAFVALWLAASLVAALYIVRRLGLPAWWLAFPPLVEGTAHANPGIVLIALLLLGRPWAGALAAGLKAYAVLPLVGQREWRSLALLAAGVALSVLLWPALWGAYLAQLPAISARLVEETTGGLGAGALPWLLPPTVLALGWIAWRDLRAAGWLATPALWPGSQFHYSAMAMPVATVLLGTLLALPIPGMPAVAVIAYAILQSRTSLRWRVERVRRAAGTPAARASS